MKEKHQKLKFEQFKEINEVRKNLIEMHSKIHKFWENIELINNSLWNYSRKNPNSQLYKIEELKIDFTTFRNSIKTEVYLFYSELEIRLKKITKIIENVQEIQKDVEPGSEITL